MNSKTIFKYLFLLTVIIAIALLFLSPKTGAILLIAAIWIHPKTANLLQRINLYFYDHTIWIGYFVLILVSILAFFIKPVEKKVVHEHSVTEEWVYDENTGLEYKKCSECGEIAEKRVPDLEYSNLPPTIESEDNENTDEDITEEENLNNEEITENITEETETTEGDEGYITEEDFIEEE